MLALHDVGSHPGRGCAALRGSGRRSWRLDTSTRTCVTAWGRTAGGVGADAVCHGDAVVCSEDEEPRRGGHRGEGPLPRGQPAIPPDAQGRVLQG